MAFSDEFPLPILGGGELVAAEGSWSLITPGGDFKSFLAGIIPDSEMTLYGLHCQSIVDAMDCFQAFIDDKLAWQIPPECRVGRLLKSNYAIQECWMLLRSWYRVDKSGKFVPA